MSTKRPGTDSCCSTHITLLSYDSSSVSYLQNASFLRVLPPSFFKGKNCCSTETFSYRLFLSFSAKSSLLLPIVFFCFQRNSSFPRRPLYSRTDFSVFRFSASSECFLLPPSSRFFVRCSAKCGMMFQKQNLSPTYIR